jgi:hypothetical protein
MHPIMVNFPWSSPPLTACHTWIIPVQEPLAGKS